MGSCYTQKPKIDEDVKQFQSMHATTSPKPEKPHNDSMVEGNRDAYFSAEEQKYYHEHCNSFDLASVQPEKHSQISWTNTQQVLGQGSFGIVHLGINTATGQLLAVKQVYLKGFNIHNDDWVSTSYNVQQRIQSFEWEIELLKRLQHPNIVLYYGMEKTEERLNLFMEYVAGGSIVSLLARYGKFKETLIQVYIRQILLGLEYLHQHGVIHRDIKGANVLVDDNGRCKLADFGSSKKLSEILQKEEFKTLIGTVNWMAPEVISMTGHGRFADIWSVGCTMIEMATGKPPWMEIPYQNQMMLMVHISKSIKPPKLPESLSDGARDFLSKCLQVKPEERWNVRKLLQHPWMVAKEPEKRNFSVSNQSEEFQRVLNQSKFRLAHKSTSKE